VETFPAVPSQPSLLVQDSFDIHPTQTTGSVTATIIGNDQILWGIRRRTTEKSRSKSHFIGGFTST
jgi:hypothetical protein